MDELSVFKTVAECVPVKGYRRSIIYDFFRKKYDFIPNSLFEILQNDGRTIDAIKEEYGNNPIVNEYFDFLVENDYVFFCRAEAYPNFKALDLNWSYPAFISSAVIILDENEEKDLVSVFSQLEELGCKHMLWVSDEIRDLEFYVSLLDIVVKSSFLSIDITTKFNHKISDSEIQIFVLQHPRLRAFINHSSPANKVISKKERVFGLIVFSKDGLQLNGDHRRNIRDYFNINIDLFCESQKHNTYYNGKIFIHSKGRISNSHGLENFGYVQTTPLSKAIEITGFKTLWGIHKEMIEVCKDCEFRHMCVDKRIPVQKEDGAWHHESECFYNPYISKWKDEEKHKSLESVGS
jgi:SPASM domain peptide maturase of grasp-with-spasm system